MNARKHGRDERDACGPATPYFADLERFNRKIGPCIRGLSASEGARSAQGSIVRFARARSGLAAVEFAFIAPIMIFLFFATVEGSDALATSRRVTLAVNTLADLVAQEVEIEAAALTDLFTGMEDIIDTGTITVEFRVVSVVMNTETNEAEVHWSRSSAGSTPYTAGSKYTGPANVSAIDPTASLLIAEVTYQYTPVFSSVVLETVNFAKSASKWPRRSPRVQFCVSAGNCTT